MSLLVGCAYHSPMTDQANTKNYQSLERGSYRGSYYEVAKGDTLYFISYVTDKNVNDLITYNELTPPYTIYPGQKLRLWRPRYTAPQYGERAEAAPAVAVVATASKPVAVKEPVSPPSNVKDVTSEPVKTIPSAHNNVAKTVDPVKPSEYSQQESKQTVTKDTHPASVQPTETQPEKPAPVKPTPTSEPAKPEPVKPAPKPEPVKVSDWMWPTKGRVISTFSSSTNGNKGIDIAGQRGQSINATAAGTVVYAGNALRGYGNLIIVKHNDDFLSAYAHNDQLFVKENQTVTAGQKIATMGSSGAQSVKLHFEIRYKGKSVDPMKYLN